jgi:hypothetical protein
MLFTPDEPIMSLSGDRPYQPSHRSTGEVGFLGAYFNSPSLPSVPAYQYFCTGHCLNGGPLLTLRLRGGLPAQSR